MADQFKLANQKNKKKGEKVIKSMDFFFKQN